MIARPRAWDGEHVIEPHAAILRVSIDGGGGLPTPEPHRAARPSAVAFAPAEVPATPWDPPLAAALVHRGRAVFEDQVVGTLLG